MRKDGRDRKRKRKGERYSGESERITEATERETREKNNLEKDCRREEGRKEGMHGETRKKK